MRLSLSLTLLAICVAGCPSNKQDPEPENQAIELGTATSNEPLPEDKRKLPPADLDAPVDRAKLRTPWARVAVGDWATFETPDGAVRLAVTAVGANTVTIERDGKASTVHLAAADREFLVDVDPDAKDPSYHALTDETLEVGDDALDCLVVTRSEAPGTSFWFCPDLAIAQGVVLRTVDGETVWKLTGFGSN